MKWLRDAARGEWLRPLIDSDWSSAPSMHSVVPRGFEAYARIFHPVIADRPVGGSWKQANPREPLLGELDSRLASWSEIAAVTGTTVHPLMQWHAIAKQRLYSSGETIDDAGWRYSVPQQGVLEAGVLADLAAVLARHTTTPDAGVAAIWEGWGGLVTGDGAAFALPQRGHVLVDAGVHEFESAEWPETAPWLEGQIMQESPSLIWPDDHAWVLVTEVDFDSTVVAGTRALVDEITRHPMLEAFEIAEGADLSCLGDHINPNPGHD